MEKRVEVASSFLENAPTGEYDQCTNALKGLLKDDPNVVKKAVKDSFEKYITKTCPIIEIGETNVIFCEEGKISKELYINPVDYTIFRFDFTKRILVEKGIPMTAKSSELRTEIQKRMNNYVKIAYRSKYAAGVYDKLRKVKSDGEKSKNDKKDSVPQFKVDEDTITIILRSNSCSLKNYRTGGIIARYIYKPSTGSLTGTIQSTQHYFECGNVMATTSNELTAELPPKNLDALVNKIREFEDSWMSGYMAALERMATDGVTRFRRKQAITGTKINWEAEFRGIGH
ncbi:F-actin capping protein alpha subunit [Tritrichomonas foetus]|uniref:F-actin-capping protein subunit alpha n=1 Tax=Tritrichomonas foetus TaxID=1144522 RepID=A0A1J4JS72_9EUKA|nr:F-actin capping protein alpha subunit [Tritrichomonas foetus]|eukprot:OHT00358.1 F-actin capping protein alpha subunit [Tritrichomonas foetus]